MFRSHCRRLRIDFPCIHERKQDICLSQHRACHYEIIFSPWHLFCFRVPGRRDATCISCSATTFQARNLNIQGSELGETHRYLGFGPARFQWSPGTDAPIACTEATKSRKVLINLSLHHTRLPKQPLMISRLPATEYTFCLHSWQLSWDSANLEAPVQWPWQSLYDQFAQAT